MGHGIKHSHDSTKLCLVLLIALISSPLADATAAPIGADPEFLAGLDLPGRARINRILVAGSHTFVVSRKGRRDNPELLIFDTLVVQSPQLVGTLKIGRNVNDIVVSGDFAYLAVEDPLRELIIVDISDKTAPTILTHLDLPPNTKGRAVAVSGGMLYLGTRKNSYGELFVVDIATPSAPSVYGSLELSAHVNAIVASSDEIFVASSHRMRDIVAIDASAQRSPYVAYYYDIEGSRQPLSLDYNLGHLFVGLKKKRGSADFIVLEAPGGSLTYAGGIALGVNNLGVSVYSDVAYVVSNKKDRELAIVDISDVSNPRAVALLAVSKRGKSVALNNGFVYASAENGDEEWRLLNPGISIAANVRDINGDGIVSIACLGDSNTDDRFVDQAQWCSQLQEQLQQAGYENWETRNFGVVTATAISGLSTTEFYGEAQVQRAFAISAPDVMVFAFGTNDVAAVIAEAELRLEDVISAYSQLVAAAEVLEPGIQTFICQTPPRELWAQANALAQELNNLSLQSFPNAMIVDLYSSMDLAADYVDFVHMNEAGQGKRATAVFDKLIYGE